jgi:hypothetical protein
MKEKSKSCLRTLSMATALLEMGSGSGSTPESAAANWHALKRSNKREVRKLFIYSQVVYPENSTVGRHCQFAALPISQFDFLLGFSAYSAEFSAASAISGFAVLLQASARP